ncbi:MAG TPA: hypothetical protein VN761_08060, partial [Candidatus Polarisedimenticolia bacterium]|nr:hypothetical protein [Candidatus Polarisedimenticolia bacterium]
ALPTSFFWQENLATGVIYFREVPTEDFEAKRFSDAHGQSARGLAHSKTLARSMRAFCLAKRLGLRWPSTAFL